MWRFAARASGFYFHQIPGRNPLLLMESSNYGMPDQGSCCRVPLSLRLFSPCQAIWAKPHMLPRCSPPPCQFQHYWTVEYCAYLYFRSSYPSHNNCSWIVTSFSSEHQTMWNTKIRGNYKWAAEPLWAYLLIYKQAITIILAGLIWENKWNNSCKASKCS